MSNPWVLLAGIAAVGVLYVLLPVVADTYFRFRARRRVECPETGVSAEVGVDARHAALTAAFRNPLVRVKECSLWPERKGCAQGCTTRLEDEAAVTPAARAR